MRSFLLLSVLVSSLLGPPAFASEAERYRLEQELVKLAQRNAWSGVERTYQDMVKLAVPLSPSTHLLGSQAADARGEVAEVLARLEKAVAGGDEASTDPAWAEAKRSLDALKARYGRVAITVVPPRLNVLVSYQTPFVAQEREAIEKARQQLIAGNAYAGLLPVGKYMVDGLVFEIEPGGEPVEVKVTP